MNSDQNRAWLARALRTEASIAAIPNLIDRADRQGSDYPLFVDHARGAYLWDVDGQRYLDFVGQFGAIILGHADSQVNEAVMDAMRRGSSGTIRSTAHVELAELFATLFESVDMAHFLRTGSDATSAAVKLSRAYTGRDRVVRWGYHGWHDWCSPRPNGVPREYWDLTQTFTYNDIASLRAVLEDGAPPACVIMMAYELESPEPGFLVAARDLAHSFGALFVLDEVRSGFRVGLRGAQGLFSITPDLSCFSKAMGNGFSISALAGRGDVMEHLGDISHSSSFFRSSDGVTAALATLHKLMDDDPYERIWQLGQQLMDGMRAAAQRAGVPVTVVGLPPTPFHRFSDDGEVDLAAQRTFSAAAATRGVLVHPAHHWFIGAAMTTEDIASALEAFEYAYECTAKMLSAT